MKQTVYSGRPFAPVPLPAGSFSFPRCFVRIRKSDFTRLCNDLLATCTTHTPPHYYMGVSRVVSTAVREEPASAVVEQLHVAPAPRTSALVVLSPFAYVP